ncbi:uncharacterized protein LOC109433489 [Aedes albopictus]|uniref:Integrase catalytic domain-containing protein n=1 Tax=Aedes albopictus TaxID=7160 RepID=A0ABM1YB26_AEDAL
MSSQVGQHSLYRKVPEIGEPPPISSSTRLGRQLEPRQYQKTNAAGINSRVGSQVKVQSSERLPPAKSKHFSEVNRYESVPQLHQQQLAGLSSVLPPEATGMSASNRLQSTQPSYQSAQWNQSVLPPPGFEKFITKPAVRYQQPGMSQCYPAQQSENSNDLGYHQNQASVSSAPLPPQAMSSSRLYTSQTAPEPSHPPILNRRTGPTPDQLAARQVIPKELPAFAGDPQDWPLFFSSFNNSTEACGYNDAENLARLQRCLRGHALESVRSRLLIPESVPYVMSTLARLYGRPEVIIHSLLKRMREIPSPKSDDLKTLIKFGMGVGNLVEHMILADQRQHISNPMLLQEMVDRLPPNLKLQWASHKRSYQNVDLATFNDFMTDLVAMASDVTLQMEPVQTNSGRWEKPKKEKFSKEKLFVHQQSAAASGLKSITSNRQRESSDLAAKPCTFCSKTDHRIAECLEFKKLNLDERWKVMRQKGLCRICLIPHRTWPCRSKQECGIEECRMRHHPLLHSKKPEPTASHPPSPAVRNIAHQHHHTATSYALLRYIPVTLHGNGKSVELFAFLDDGSSSTMLEAGVANILGIEGPNEPLSLGWTGDVTRIEKESQRIEVSITGASGKKFWPLKAKTVGPLKLPCQTVDYAELCETHPHLKHLPLISYTNVSPQLIIGVDNAKLISSLKNRESATGELIVSKTRLGWCIYGTHTAKRRFVEFVNTHVELSDNEAGLHDLFRQFLAVEEATIKQNPQSEEDKRALMILQETTRRVGRRFETGLLWRDDDPCLPNSLPMAVRRMEALERKLAKDPWLSDKVRGQIAEYVEKGYAHPITTAEVESTEPGRVWYLPLGVVRNPRKPEKVRLIWDAAARVEGVSLNDRMMKGPDLLAALPTILLRFRQKRIAFSGDIKEMFHQFLIRPRDRQAQRFVFRESPDQQPTIFVMDVATFGASCSPCIAHYLKNRNAEEYAEQFPDAATAIIENHYVDDFLDSVDTVDEAVQLIQEVKYVHSMAGMEIRNFSSNSVEVLGRIGEVDKNQHKSLSPESVERVLGMVWRPSEDDFSFELNLKEEIRNIVQRQKVPTKRQVLRTIMSLFDPLGLVAHFTIQGKLIMQRIWRTGADWDDAIEGDVLEEWIRWSKLLERISEARVPRCFFASSGATIKDKQIHVFVDASENAYACVAYIRSSYEDDEPRCTLIAAKTKVAPLRPLSIPRLELQAALVGARLLDGICKSLTIPVGARYLWSDSTTVLAWLRSETRRYHQFVGFRVGEILSITTVDEWRKIPSKINVADQATKWRDGPSFDPKDWWFSGPDFLRDPMENWMEQNEGMYETTEDLRTICLHHRKIASPLINVDRFSQWSRLCRTAGYVVRAVKLFLGMKATGPLTHEELQRAESLLWREVQMQEYPDEYATLTHNRDISEEPKQLNKSSPLYKMSPVMDADGVIRMDSRIIAAPRVTLEAKYPILLPRNSRVTKLLVESYHIRFLHQNNETVFNELRQRFRIPRLRTVIAKTAKECQYCRIRKASPQPPIMAALPETRLTAFVRPFTHTGVDYFGPILVKQGRSLVKRWIALFTCLSIRAVHLEIVHTVSASSCIMAIRRFIARRGSPLTFCSDNGTNFVGASNLLKEQLQEINKNCALSFTNSYTKWLFNPPLAPHMGGSWERMVRSVKAAMAAIAEYPRHPNDEVLETIALEAESIVNSRPLTYIPLDNVEQEALTPNHFLLYGTQGINQPSQDIAVDHTTLRDSWKLAQYLVDTFWRRWVHEYLPTLTRRTKWFQPVKPMMPGDLVIVVEDGRRNGWLRGRIVEVVRGKDDQVRRATVKTSKGIISRPATKLALLDVRGPAEEAEADRENVPELHGWGDVGEPLGKPSPQ